jgi:hypothetical protein
MGRNGKQRPARLQPLKVNRVRGVKELVVFWHVLPGTDRKGQGRAYEKAHDLLTKLRARRDWSYDGPEERFVIAAEGRTVQRIQHILAKVGIHDVRFGARFKGKETGMRGHVLPPAGGGDPNVRFKKATSARNARARDVEREQKRKLPVRLLKDLFPDQFAPTVKVIPESIQQTLDSVEWQANGQPAPSDWFDWGKGFNLQLWFKLSEKWPDFPKLAILIFQMWAMTQEHGTAREANEWTGKLTMLQAWVKRFIPGYKRPERVLYKDDSPPEKNPPAPRAYGVETMCLPERLGDDSPPAEPKPFVEDFRAPVVAETSRWDSHWDLWNARMRSLQNRAKKGATNILEYRPN